MHTESESKQKDTAWMPRLCIALQISQKEKWKEMQKAK